MVFNSYNFLIFFVAFFFLYWIVLKKNVRLQNGLILLSSYIFYCFADWRFLFLLVITSLVTFFLALEINKTDSSRKKTTLLRIGVVMSIGTLLYFKYTNFFIQSFLSLFDLLNLKTNLSTINILLPLGISFYTFRQLSYLLDVYYGKMKPTQNWVSFFGYVAFFPELFSGPIDRAKNLLPQFEKKREFDYGLAVDGLRQILVGLFKKIVIADSCAPMVNEIFNGYQNLPGSTLFVGAFIYAFQLYTDFSGYSDMAIGIGKLMGFKLTPNFAFPFFSKNISDYWKKWHISLTSWLTDYVFTPLSIRFRNYGEFGLILSIILTFIIVGAWHDAKWTWIVYGFLNGLLFIPLILKGNVLRGGGVIAKNKRLPTFRELISMITTFITVMLLFVVNRSENIQSAFLYLKKIFSLSFFSPPTGIEINKKSIVFIIILILIEWIQREKKHFLQIDGIKNPAVRFCIYYTLIFLILKFGGSQQQFIYFQF